MITSLERLAASGEKDARDPSRLLRLLLHKHLKGAIYALAGLAILATLAVLWLMNPDALSELSWWGQGVSALVGLSLGASCVIRLKDALSDPLLQYWSGPELFDFAAGELTAEEARASRYGVGAGHVLAKGTFQLPDGRKEAFSEPFEHLAWLGLNPASRLRPEQSISLAGAAQEGPGLPIPVTVLYERARPQRACLAAIPAEVAAKALAAQPSETLMQLLIVFLAFSLLLLVMPVYVIKGPLMAAAAAMGLSALIVGLAMGASALFKLESLPWQSLLLVLGFTWLLILVALSLTHRWALLLVLAGPIAVGLAVNLLGRLGRGR